MTRQLPDKQLKQIFVVSHTHWDREWYQDFQSYRIRLVYLMDELLDHLHRDPSYRHFMLDGQTIVINDYLEIRPEREEELRNFLRQGRLAAGPWYVMPDEFLVGGESLVRNLLVGFRQARRMGTEPMKSGYMTDIFGHNSQMPQIFRGFGIDNAVFFRGFHGNGDPSELWWEGADGSRVLGLKLDEDRSYSDFYFFLRWPFADRAFRYDEEELIQRAEAMIAYKSERVTTDIALSLDGCDHVEIEPRLGWMLERLNNEKTGVEWKHGKLEDYVAELHGRIGNLEVFNGEQRLPGYNGVNNAVLANVLSSRVHLKQLNQASENLLTGWAEPWSIFVSREGRSYPKSFLDQAWKHLLENHPHDSICGCSITPVHEDMLYRFAQSRSIGERMTSEAFAFVSGHVDEKALHGRHAVVVFNSSQRPVKGIVQLELELPASSFIPSVSPESGGTNFRLLDAEGREVPFQVISLKKNSMKRWRPYRDIPHGEGVDWLNVALQADVPSFGYTTYTVDMNASQPPGNRDYAFRKLAEPIRYIGSQQVSPNVWENGKIRLEVGANGTLLLQDLDTGFETRGLLTFEDEADIGDGWKYIAPIVNETVHSSVGQASLSIVHDGPLETCLRIALRIELPQAMDPSRTRRSEERISLPITTFVTIRNNDSLIRCRTVVENGVRDHRLKLLFPTGVDSDMYYTGTPFDVVERSVKKADYSRHMEKDSGVVPHNGLLAIRGERQGFAVYSKGLYEAQMRDDQTRTAVLTLYRSTRDEVLSDGGDGGQLLGRLEFEYAFRPFDAVAVSFGDLLAEQQQFALGIRTINRNPGPVAFETLCRREADLPPVRSYLNVSGNDLIVSACKRAEDDSEAWIIRLWNSAELETNGTIQLPYPVLRAEKVDLDEQTIGPVEAVQGNSLNVAAKAKEIVTLKLWFA
ncbi:alpha-mannosidase [Cohnella silvisoli]|uniref:Glycoside hydrolase family 38 C-terminal domain-containing protein n=1 Tax=Cohnella silvisoli TaxID=2873699 RepID=A0ABV1KQU2_9BACL|nr:glycoside hydrolase family 38 C-terminal domain-containing protein [Cohnella silvisoli]MCD9024576.1 hypothetical protein [Cohnella silvisoli]